MLYVKYRTLCELKVQDIIFVGDIIIAHTRLTNHNSKKEKIIKLIDE